MEIKRNFADAPSASTQKSIREWLLERGAKGIISTTAVAEIVGVSERTVKNAENSGELSVVDKRTYTLDSVVEWLMKNQRYVAQDTGRFELTPEVYDHVRKMLHKFAQPLIRLYNNDVEELVSEICCRLTKRRLTNDVSLSTVIYREIVNFSNSKTSNRRRQTVMVNPLVMQHCFEGETHDDVN